MGLFQRISQWLSQSDSDTAINTRQHLNQLISEAHRAQYGEDYEQALDYLHQADDVAEKLRDARTQIDINLSRADILIMQGDYETARFVLDELRDDSEARHLKAPLAYALCSLGVLEQKLGDTAKAQASFEKARETAKAIDTDGASGRATGHLGDIYMQDGNASYAAYLYEESVEKLDRSGDRELLGHFLGQLGMAQLKLGERNKGRLHLQRGLDVALSIKHTQQIRELSVLVGDYAFNNDDFHRAQAYYEDALKFYTDDPPTIIDFAHLLIKLSRTALKIGDTLNAQSYANQVLNLSTEDTKLTAMAKATLGIATPDSKDDEVRSYLEDAIDYYRDTQADSFYIDVLRNLAKIQFKQGEEETAFMTYRAAIEAAEDLPFEAAKVMSELATHYAQKRDLREALNLWQQAVKKFEEAHQLDYVAATQCDVAQMHDQLGDGRMAQRAYGNALEMLGRVDSTQMRGIILANVAAAYSMYGDVDSAEDFFKESIDIAINTTDVIASVVRRSNYGRLLVLTNRPEAALIELAPAQKHAAERAYDLPAGVILGTMGMAYIIAGDVRRSQQHFEQSLHILRILNAEEWEARVIANWADGAVMQDDFETAQARYDAAFKLAQSYGLIDVLIQIIIGRATIAIAENRLDDAESNLTKITPTAKRQGYQQLLAQLHQTWSELYAKQGKQEQAQSAWDSAQQIRTIMQMKPINPDWL